MPLPKGTRVVLRGAVVDDRGHEHRSGTLAVVLAHTDRSVSLETPSGAFLSTDRDNVSLHREDLLVDLARRQWDHRILRSEVIHAAVVGSHAWGLANAESDEDVRGCFVLPFEVHASLWDAPGEIHDDDNDEAFWEIEKLMRQGLRGDANTLESLWSPLVKEQTALGRRLVDERDIFSSTRVLASFGRYAQSQLKKLENGALRQRSIAALLRAVADGQVRDEKAARAHAKDETELASWVRSLFDRGLIRSSSFADVVVAVDQIGADALISEELRPKNAYNLVRLLHSCVHWWREGTPLLRVDGELRTQLLDIKEGRTDLAQTLALAREAATLVDVVCRESTPLPEQPQTDAADALLREARRQQARKAVPTPAVSPAAARSSMTDAFVPHYFPVPLPGDVDLERLRRFLEPYVVERRILWMGLTGSHAYGFVSPDSDLDLKAVHAQPARELLGLASPRPPLEVLTVFEGTEMDLSSHELSQMAALLLKGNGNMIERLLGPLPIVVTPFGERLRDVARATLSTRVVHHSRGFLFAMKREYDVEAQRGERKAKRLLYAYRVALTGTHLLLTGDVVTDVVRLGPEYGFGEKVERLVALKRLAERQHLEPGEDERYLEDIDKLASLLDDAEARSVLPESPAALDKLDALLVEARLSL